MTPQDQNPILRECVVVLIPLILLYALYVQFHGDIGPGGGFQAGILFAVGIIIYSLVFGYQRALNIISLRSAELFACLGVFLYGGTGLATFLLGGDFLDYRLLSDDPLDGQHIGIFIVELGIGITIF
ncbi:MAG: Na(+)/H(+) antiporter subunit B, partial [Candidatus Oxydemutatoraceae bacterium WSBS_2016_MAG_OTU14]